MKTAEDFAGGCRHHHYTWCADCVAKQVAEARREALEDLRAQVRREVTVCVDAAILALAAKEPGRG